MFTISGYNSLKNVQRNKTEESSKEGKSHNSNVLVSSINLENDFGLNKNKS